MEYCSGVETSISSTGFTILLSIYFAGNFSPKVELYVTDIASVALIRGASAPRFFRMLILLKGELIVIGREFCCVNPPMSFEMHFQDF